MIKELDPVVLTQSLPEQRLQAGDAMHRAKSATVPPKPESLEKGSLDPTGRMAVCQEILGLSFALR